jgi:1,4-alpha-glucan branching enzyme
VIKILLRCLKYDCLRVARLNATVRAIRAVATMNAIATTTIAERAMSSLHNYNPRKLNTYSAKATVKPVPFVCLAQEAQQVFVAGDFNDWDPASHPMKRMPDGAWRLEISLNHGHHHYLFLVDGKPLLDPKAQGIARNEKGEKVSLLAVS